ncbi:FAD-binding protein [Streptomyces sp. NBC_01298]|uniref:FAD-binding protein n=1 Tax=Streptomyces sp. NBC_01298 TaxID=2903817 RepID=UPI002E157683|nr:FAD-binding protein [Streptomyces sp. NBC_01298]
MTAVITDEGPLPRHSTVIVVGGGLAGLETARGLEALGVDDVLVLEAGPADDLRHVNQAYGPDLALRQWLLPDTDPYFRRPWSSANPPHFTGGSGIRRRLGGRSLYWYGVVLPMEPWALAEPWWPASVIKDLRETWCGGASLYERTLARLEAWTGTGLVGRAPSRPMGGVTLAPVPLAVRPGAGGRGRWSAYTPLDDWRDPRTGTALRTPVGVRIRTSAEVVRVAVRAGRASGVVVRDTANGVEREVGAEAVVLAAGTIAGTALAIEAMSEAGPQPVNQLGGLYDHMVQGFFVRLEGAVAARTLEAFPPGSYYASYEPSCRSNVFVHVQHLLDGSVLVDVQLTGEQLPSDGNRVECTRDAAGRWALVVHSRVTDADQEVLRAQQARLKALWDGFARDAGLMPSALTFGDFDSPARTNSFVLPESMNDVPAGIPMTWSGFIGTEDHEGGTLPLGRVLTERHEFRDVARLYAAGPATFPRMGAANPSLTTLALAHRLAAVLAGEYR